MDLKKFFQSVSRQRQASVILACLLGISYLFAAYATLTTNIIPGKYVGGLYLISLAVVAALIYFLYTKRINQKVRTILLILAVLGTLINGYIYIVGTAAGSLIRSTQENTQVYEEYSIVAIKDRGVTLATPDQPTAILSSEPDLTRVKEGGRTKTKASYRDYADPTSSMLALESGETTMAIYKSSYLRTLSETYSTVQTNKLITLATFNVAISSSHNTVNGDVSKPFVIYISGIDTYGAISTTSRSDVNIIAVVNPVTHRILLVNTPRDYYVQLHGTTGVKDKLTHAGLYGVDASTATLKDLYGVDINYNMRINFSSLVKIVDSLGGIEVDSEYTFSSGKHHFVEGKNSLNGEQALAFSRNRYSFEGGDRTRGENQQQVIKAIIAKISTPSTIVRSQSILKSLEGTFQTNMSVGDITSIIRNQLDTMAKWQVQSISVDGTGASEPTYSMGAQRLYVMVPDPASVMAAQTAIQNTLR